MKTITRLSTVTPALDGESSNDSGASLRANGPSLGMALPRLVLLVGVAVVLLGVASCSGTRGGSDTGIELFNGRNLAGWKHVLADPSVPREKVWSVRDGLIVCQGEPFGFLYTEREFTNFRLEVQYRWPPGAKPGNSGIFSRVNDFSHAVPRCVEVQLMHGSAGDVLTLQGMKLGAEQPRFFHVAKHAVAGDIDGVKKTQDAEAAPGEWNRVEILAQGGSYTVWVNGQKVNEAVGVERQRGPIGLQSEGGEIHFRRVMITPLP